MQDVGWVESLSSVQAVGCVDVCNRGEGVADDLLCSIDYSLERLPLSLGAMCEPHCDTL